MKLLSLKFLLVFLFLRVVDGVGYNEVVEVGEQQYTINCTEPDGITAVQTRWYIDRVKIYDSDDQGATDSRFDMSDRLYDLIIRQMDHSTSGLYECDMVLQGPNIEAEYGIVAIDGPKCLERKEFDQGNTIILDYEFTYSTPSNPNYAFTPRVRCFDENGQEQPGESLPPDNPPSPGDEIEITYTMNGGSATIAHNDAMYTCWVDFEAPSSAPSAGLPTYRGSCTTVVKVRHPPQDTRIEPSSHDGSLNVAVGDVFNCTTSAYPEPDTYWWHREDGNGPLDIFDWQMEVVPAHASSRNVYTCTVSFQGAEDSDTVTFYAGTSGAGTVTFCPLALFILAVLFAVLNAV